MRFHPKYDHTLNMEGPLGIVGIVLVREQAALTDSSHAVSSCVRVCWGGSLRSRELKASSTRVRKGVVR